MKITKEIRGLKYNFDNELYVLVKRTCNSQPSLAPNSYFSNKHEVRCLEFAGNYMDCKKQIMHIAAQVCGGLYMDQSVPNEDWYVGTGIYSCFEKEEICLVYSIHQDHFEHGNDAYDILMVEDEVALICELGSQKDFFTVLMDKVDMEIIDGNGKRIIGYPQKLELRCKEYEAGNAEKECHTSIFSELWRKRKEASGPVLTDYVGN